MKNKIEDLRNHLFATLEALQDKETPMELDRARTISEVAKTIISSAQVEVEMMRAVGATQGTGFVSLPAPSTPPPGAPRLVKGSAQSGAD